MPKPEIYVIYTGEKPPAEKRLSLTQDFFGGDDADLNICATVITEDNSCDIVDQYIKFCKVFNGQIKIHGLKKAAITETIRICKDSDILAEYLENRRTEVITVLEFLFDQDEVTRLFGIEKYREGEFEGRKEGRKELAFSSAAALLKSNKLTIDEVRDFYPDLTDEDIKKLST